MRFRPQRRNDWYTISSLNRDTNVTDDLISRYKKSFRIRFRNADTEANYRELQLQGGQDSSILAFGALFILSSAFAYLEFRAFGHDVRPSNRARRGVPTICSLICSARCRPRRDRPG